MIAIILSLLPFVNSQNADLSTRVQVSPGISITFHSDSWYDQREKERRENQERIQAERNAERERQEAFDRERQRGNLSPYFWRDTRDQHEQKRRKMEETRRLNEQVRANREQSMREEEARDREERNHQKDELKDKDDNRGHREHDQRNNKGRK